MKVSPTTFKEVLLIKTDRHKDIRGTFTVSYNNDDFAAIVGRQINFCQDNITRSHKGVLRGLHYQLPPNSQSKLVSVLEGHVIDIVVDMREGSPTFGKHFAQELSDINNLQIFIPRGFALN